MTFWLIKLTGEDRLATCVVLWRFVEELLEIIDVSLQLDSKTLDVHKGRS